MVYSCLKKFLKMQTCIVVPCFNEEFRWDINFWVFLKEHNGIELIFVDDGSTDQTLQLLRKTASLTGASVVVSSNNLGKAEAIRLGLNQAIGTGSDEIAFLDADGAFSSDDISRLISVFKTLKHSGQASCLWSSRVALAGRVIQRSTRRHYFARTLITILAFRYKFNVYDTQSGFKIFSVTEAFRYSLESKFHTRWFVDLEIYLRMTSYTKQPPAIWEEPVQMWRDVENSKLGGWGSTTVIRDLIRLYWNYPKTSRSSE